MSPGMIAKLVGGALLILLIIVGGSCSTYVVNPGYRGVQVTLGKVSPVPKPEGFGLEFGPRASFDAEEQGGL